MKRLFLSLSAATALVMVATTTSWSQAPDMKYWVEVTQGPLNVRTCPSVSCPIISDLERPSLVSRIPKGGRIKVLSQAKADDNLSCIETNCLWFETGEGWIHSAFVKEIPAPAPITFSCPKNETTCVVIDTQIQSVHLIQNGKDIYRTWVSTGRFSPTPKGVHWVGWQLRFRRMVGGVRGTSSHFDLPKIPWVTYFTSRGDAFHGTYWHRLYGTPRSHGCVNMENYDAQVVYEFAPPGTIVVVR